MPAARSPPDDGHMPITIDRTARRRPLPTHERTTNAVVWSIGLVVAAILIAIVTWIVVYLVALCTWAELCDRDAITPIFIGGGVAAGAALVGAAAVAWEAIRGSRGYGGR